MNQLDAFDYFAFVVMGVLFLALFVIIVLLGALPGRIAASRNHPCATAISAASWISPFTLGLLWPIAFVWAFIPPRSNSSADDGGEAR